MKRFPINNQIKNYFDFLQKTHFIRGWLQYEDFVIFSKILDHQLLSSTGSNILEVGCFEGQSAALLASKMSKKENLHICDLFDGPTDPSNQLENATSYPGLTKHKFERNMEKVGARNFKLWEMSSTSLNAGYFSEKFRFIHIDGSHLYDHIASDIAFCMSVINESYGVIAIDDYREYHTVGVAAAIWESIVNSKVIPFMITPGKIYVLPPNTKFDIDKIFKELKRDGFQVKLERVFDFSVLRLLQSKYSRIERSYVIFRKVKIRLLIALMGLLKKIRNSDRNH